MSERLHDAPTPEGEYFEKSRFAGLSMLFAVLAVVGLGLSVLGGYLSPKQFSFSWLFGFAFFFTVFSGCLFWIIVHYATDAEWTVVVRRQLENLTALFPVLAILFIPVLLLRHHLFDWMNIAEGADPVLDSKRAYLNWNFFLIRAVIFFGFFSFSAFLLRSYSVRQDKDGNPGFTITLRKIAFISLPLFGLCLTFAGFDWLMSLNYKWYSTMWGPYLFAGAAGSSMSFLVLVITALRKAGYLQQTVTLEHYHIMG